MAQPTSTMSLGRKGCALSSKKLPEKWGGGHVSCSQGVRRHYRAPQVKTHDRPRSWLHAAMWVSSPCPRATDSVLQGKDEAQLRAQVGTWVLGCCQLCVGSH